MKRMSLKCWCDQQEGVLQASSQKLEVHEDFTLHVHGLLALANQLLRFLAAHTAIETRIADVVRRPV